MNGLIVHINSKIDRRPQDTTSNFTTYFSTPLEVSLESQIGVLMAEVPYTCTQFKDSNNTFWVEQAYVDTDGDGNAITVKNCLGIQIDDDVFYDSIEEVITALNAVCTASNYPVLFSILNNRIRVQNTSTTIKMRVISISDFETSTTGSIYLNGSLTSYKQFFNQMQNKLGFTKNYLDQYLYPDDIETANGIPTLIRSNCFYIEADIVDSHQMTPSPFKSPNIICKIPFTGNFGSIQTYFTETPLMVRCNDTSIDEIRFKILDDELEEVNLNGASVSLTLIIK